MNMKKEYESAELELVDLCQDDVITASLISGTNGSDFYEDENNWADGPIPPRN